jgi:GntR family negative regulator for fad regulon and positive regulator of fabA
MTGFAIIREPFYALQQSHYMVIKAQSPAGFAEEYIIESIWNNRFPQDPFCRRSASCPN